MIDALLHILYSHLPGKSYWHKAKFSEVTDLYISMSFKTLSLSLVGIFVPVFLYQTGYSLGEIITFYIIVSLVQMVGIFLSGLLVARNGPKHVLRYSYVLLLVLFVLLFYLPQVAVPLWVIALVNGLHFSSFIMAYHVDFSKVQNSEKAGSEIGNMMIILKTVAALGPFIGGAIASLFGIEWTLIVSAAFLLFAAIPLMTSGEPVRQHQVVRFQGLYAKKYRGIYIASAAIGIEQNASIFAWPLFISLFVFTDNVYAALGFVTSASFIVSIIAGRVFGKLVDKKRSIKSLFDYSAIALSLNHLVRPFIGSIFGVLASNSVSQVGVIGTRIPFMKGYYDHANRLKGQRIASIIMIELHNSFGRVLFWCIILGIYNYTNNEKSAISSGLVLGSLGALLITRQAFSTLKDSK